MLVVAQEEESLTSPFFIEEIEKTRVTGEKDVPIREFSLVPKYNARLSGGPGSFETSKQEGQPGIQGGFYQIKGQSKENDSVRGLQR